MAYTKQDYDNVVSLFREYESKKNSYTPEQQQQIESAFANARSKVSWRTQEANYKTVVWVRVDPQWNTYNQYNDGSQELVKSSEKPNPEIINTNNINIPTTEAVAPIETQVSEEPIQTETAPQVQTQSQTPIAKPAIKPAAQWRTWNTWVYPVWTATNWWTLMSDWSVRPASYNPNTAIPTWDKKTANARSNSMNKNIQRLLKSWYTIDNNWFLFNPSWKQVARVWTWWMMSNP